MIVGVGASRVRDLFSQAKEAAPAIIFVDELDAVGRSRAAVAANIGGGHDEREQTLNQILTEMDGFDARTGVIVLGATNRPEILDQALLRPGRFDRRVVVQPPDRVGREAILKVHTRSVPLAPEIRPRTDCLNHPGHGRRGPGEPGQRGRAAGRQADSSQGHDVKDFHRLAERIVLGAARSVMISDDDRRRTAYHEAGHAIVGMLTPGADPVRKVSIIPRGQALGVTFSRPGRRPASTLTSAHLLAQIKVALGGRCAEEVVFGDLTTGAESDIQHLTRIARFMVGRWGMSAAIGPIAVLPSEASSMLMPGVSETSGEDSQQLVDCRRPCRIVEAAHRGGAGRCSRRDAPLVSSTTWSLSCCEHETLDEADAYAAAGLTRADAAVPAQLNGTNPADGPQPIGAVGMPTENDNLD